MTSIEQNGQYNAEDEIKSINSVADAIISAVILFLNSTIFKYNLFYNY